jgi:hypothetical protein
MFGAGKNCCLPLAAIGSAEGCRMLSSGSTIEAIYELKSMDSAER